jgi:hypothetical protein
VCLHVFDCSNLGPWAGARIVEWSISESGNGKNVADSDVQKRKLYINEGLKVPGGSARTAGQYSGIVSQGQATAGVQRSCDVGEMVFDRPLDVGGATAGTVPGIQNLYYIEWKYGTDDKFLAMTVQGHRGVGVGHVFDADQCRKLWKGEGLCSDTKAQLKVETGGITGVNDGGRLIRGTSMRTPSACKQFKRAETRRR